MAGSIFALYFTWHNKKCISKEFNMSKIMLMYTVLKGLPFLSPDFHKQPSSPLN